MTQIIKKQDKELHELRQDRRSQEITMGINQDDRKAKVIDEIEAAKEVNYKNN